MASVLGIITSSANNKKVPGMQDYRPMGAFSFLGRYRVIDFPISNLVNSGFDQIQVYVRENPRSLAEHLGNESYFNINSKKGKLQLLFSSNSSENDIYNTDVAGYVENMNIIRRHPAEYVILVPSYMVFTQDFNELLNTHISSGADITCLYHHVNDAREHYLDCSVLNLNKQKGVVSIEKNKGTAKEKNIFMNTVIMKKDLFVGLIERAQKISSVYTLSQIINDACGEESDLNIVAVPHRGFFATVIDIRSYFDANLDLLDPTNQAQLFKPNWTIYTVTSDACPTKYLPGSSVRNSLIANGCIIEGTVENCVIGRGVRIGKGAVVKNCVITAYSRIGQNVDLEYQIVDKWAQIIHVDKLIGKPEKPGYIRRDDVI